MKRRVTYNTVRLNEAIMAASQAPVDLVADGAQGAFLVQRSDDPLEDRRCTHMLCVLRDAVRSLHPDAGVDFEFSRLRDGYWLFLGFRTDTLKARYCVRVGWTLNGDDFAEAERQMLSLIGA